MNFEEIMWEAIQIMDDTQIDKLCETLTEDQQAAVYDQVNAANTLNLR